MSRTIDDMILSLEQGEPLNYDRLAKLQVLDIVKAGEDFVIEMVGEEREADDRLAGHQ